MRVLTAGSTCAVARSSAPLHEVLGDQPTVRIGSGPELDPQSSTLERLQRNGPRSRAPGALSAQRKRATRQSSTSRQRRAIGNCQVWIGIEKSGHSSEEWSTYERRSGIASSKFGRRERPHSSVLRYRQPTAGLMRLSARQYRGSRRTQTHGSAREIH
jgi:hypothetical protein